MSIEDNVAIVAITKNGQELAFKINKEFKNSKVYVVNKNLDEIVKSAFKEYNYIIFIMATGIVVRAISKYIKNKFEDPAIIVIDEKGQNVISLLSGHVGGANEMTMVLSELLDANPVITTATDVNKKSSLDMIAKKINAYIDDFRESVKIVNSDLVNDKEVAIYIDGDYTVDTRGFKLLDRLEESLFKNNIFGRIVIITDRNKIDSLNIELLDKNKVIKVVPKDIVIGIGCRRGTDSNLLYESLVDLLDRENIDIKSIKQIGSIDLKEDEKAINDLSKKLNVPFEIIKREDIIKIEHLFDKSDFVKKNVGVFSVSEPVAYILSNGNLISNKYKYKGITFSIGKIS